MNTLSGGLIFVCAVIAIPLGLLLLCVLPDSVVGRWGLIHGGWIFVWPMLSLVSFAVLLPAAVFWKERQFRRAAARRDYWSRLR